MAEDQKEPETPKEPEPKEDEITVAVRNVAKSVRALIKSVTNTIERPAQETAKTYLKKASNVADGLLSAIDEGDGKKKGKKK